MMNTTTVTSDALNQNEPMDSGEPAKTSFDQTLPEPAKMNGDIKIDNRDEIRREIVRTRELYRRVQGAKTAAALDPSVQPKWISKSSCDTFD